MELAFEITKRIPSRVVCMTSGLRPIYYIPEYRLHVEQKDEDTVWVWRDNQLIQGRNLDEILIRIGRVFKICLK